MKNKNKPDDEYHCNSESLLESMRSAAEEVAKWPLWMQYAMGVSINKKVNDD